MITVVQLTREEIIDVVKNNELQRGEWITDTRSRLASECKTCAVGALIRHVTNIEDTLEINLACRAAWIAEATSGTQRGGRPEIPATVEEGRAVLEGGFPLTALSRVFEGGGKRRALTLLKYFPDVIEVRVSIPVRAGIKIIRTEAP